MNEKHRTISSPFFFVVSFEELLSLKQGFFALGKILEAAALVCLEESKV